MVRTYFRDEFQMKRTLITIDYSIKQFAKLSVLSAAFFLMACDPGQPKEDDSLKITGFAKALSQKEFNALPAEQQYQVASKLYGTLFRGISAEDFFDLSAGATNLVPLSDSFLKDTRRSLTTNITSEQLYDVNALIDGLDDEGNPNEDDAKYTFDEDTRADENEKPLQIPLARIKEYPISRDLYVQWMAYFLTNTIMYSPAVEMESTFTIDANNMYRFLEKKIQAGSNIREMVRSNLPSLARWRVSRSAENHALEAYELYLGLFETEEESVNGGVACKDFYLTDEDSGYVISNTSFPNTTPQEILGTFVTTCEDLYDLIAGHPLLLPRAGEVLTNYLFSGRSRSDKDDAIESIIGSGAETYEEIFTAIIFSKEYLLNSERPRSFEESFMPLLDTLKWDPAATTSSVDKRIFEFIASGTENPSGEGGGNNDLYLGNKGWQTMELKIGRLPDVPLDVLSFANYHMNVREHLLLRADAYDGHTADIPGLIYSGAGGESDDDLRAVVSQLSLTDYVHFLFLNAMQRKATSAELSGLLDIYDGLSLITIDTEGNQIIVPSTGNNNRHNNIATVTFDYISRLPEFYYFRAID